MMLNLTLIRLYDQQCIFPEYCFLLDLNECLTNNGDCEHICTNNDGSYECSCNPGYEIGNDGKSCDGKQVI